MCDTIDLQNGTTICKMGYGHMARKFTKRTNGKSETLSATVDCTALYLRVSTEKQADEGFSLDAQREKLIAQCTVKGWDVCPDHIYVEEGASGKSTDRPQYQRMIDAIERGDVRRIVVTKLDRLSRNTRDFLTLLDYCDAHGVGIVSIAESFDTSTPVGRAVVTVLMTFAELERKQIAERVTAGRYEKAKQGGWNGGRVPYGYTAAVDGTWTVDELAAGTVRYIFDDFTHPRRHTTLTEIAKALNDDGVATQRGGKWYASTVRYILSNGAYAGLVQYDGSETASTNHEAIITADMYHAAQQRLDALKPGKAV